MTTLDKTTIDNFAPDATRYQHSLNEAVIYTEGVQYVAEAGNACWLLDAIASHLTPDSLAFAVEQEPIVATQHIWILTVVDDVFDKGWTVMHAQANRSSYPFVEHDFGVTTFPLPSLEIRAAWGGSHWTLSLPSES